MKIKLRSNYSGARLSASAGDIIDLPEAEARQLLEAKYAVPVGGELQTTAVAGAPERAQRRPRLREVRA
jgi:hypothetical protein